jgi:hypothetical protein
LLGGRPFRGIISTGPAGFFSGDFSGDVNRLSPGGSVAPFWMVLETLKLSCKRMIHVARMPSLTGRVTTQVVSQDGEDQTNTSSRFYDDRVSSKVQ